jgi:hypothetical protein
LVNLTKIDITKVLCPKCGAEPNKPCKNKKKRNHFARMQAAQKLNSKKNKGARSMAYDNTNTGAAFKPFDSMKMILQGKINLEGNDRKVVLVADTTKSGMKIIEVYQKVGVLFENDKRGNENAPDYSGPMEDYAARTQMQIAGWKKQKDDNNYLSMQISQKHGGQQQAQQVSTAHLDVDDDTIPF